MRRFVIALGVALCVVTLGAQQSLYTNSELITVLGSGAPQGFTASKINPAGSTTPATTASCSLETANIRFVVDTQNVVTSSTGFLWVSGTNLTFKGNDTLRAFRTTAATSTSAVLNCIYSNP